MKNIASFEQSDKQNEGNRKKLYIKLAEELIGSVKQKKLQIEDLLNKQHLKMCHMQFNEENANESLNKLGKVFRLMKIVCKIIIESNPKSEKKILINPETLKQRQVKKSEYTEESEQLDSIQEDENKDFSQYLKKKDLINQNYLKEGLQKILSKVSSIYDITENQKYKNKLKMRQIADIQSIEKLEKVLNNQKRVNIKRYKSLIKICIKSLGMVTSFLKRLNIDSESESEEICSITKQFNQKYHQEQRILDSQELKSINGRMEKIYINLQQKYSKRNHMRP